MTTETFQLTSPDQNTIFCDIDLLTWSYKFILDHCTLDDLETSTGGKEEIDLPWVIDNMHIPDYTSDYLKALPEDVLGYLLPKLKSLLSHYEKMNTYLEEKQTFILNYVEHIDNINSTFECLWDSSSRFDDKETIKNILEAMESSISVEEVETAIIDHEFYFTDVRNQYSSCPNITILSHTVNDVEDQIELKEMLKELAITLDDRSLNFLFEKLKKEFTLEYTDLKEDDSIWLYANASQTIYWYTTEAKIKEAINNLINEKE